MSERIPLRQAMYGLIEATHAISSITGVPVETLVVAMLAAAKREDAERLLEAARFFAPLRKPPSLVPNSDQFESFLKLVERDNPALYRKLSSLD